MINVSSVIAVLACDHQVEKKYLNWCNKTCSTGLTPVSISLPNIVGSLPFSTVSHAIAYKRSNMYNKRWYKHYTSKKCAFGWTVVIPDASWKIWWNTVYDRMFKFLFALFMQIKKTISIGVRICCQIRNFRSLCSSRSHKRSKFNSKCGPTFSSSCAWRSAGVQVFSVMFYRNVFLNDKNIKSIRP